MTRLSCAMFLHVYSAHYTCACASTRTYLWIYILLFKSYICILINVLWTEAWMLYKIESKLIRPNSEFCCGVTAAKALFSCARFEIWARDKGFARTLDIIPHRSPPAYNPWPPQPNFFCPGSYHTNGHLPIEKDPSCKHFGFFLFF